MQSIALLLQLDDTSFSQHILVVGIEDELVLMDSFLSNSNQPSLLVTRILHRLLSIQDMCVVESSHFLSISRFVGICECYKVEPLILNLIPSLFEKNNGLLTDYLRMIQTSTIILDSLVRTIEYLSCGKVKGKSSLESELLTDSPSDICTNAILLMTSCIQTHLSLFTAISMIIPKDRLLKLFKSLVSIQPKLLFSKNSYVRSSNTFNQLSILVDITYKLGNHLTTLLSSHDVSETRSLIPETSDFLVEMYLIYPSIAHQMDQLQDMFPLIPIKVIQDALFVNKSVDETLSFLLGLMDIHEPHNSTQNDILTPVQPLQTQVKETVMVSARRNVFDNDEYDSFNNATPSRIQKKQIQKDVSGIVEYCEEYDDTYLEDVIDCKEVLLRESIKNGLFTLPRGHKARVKVQQECQMEDHLFESWYKMFVKGDSTGKCEGGNDDNFSGNVKGGKQSWTDRKKGVFGGLHAADEVYEEDSEEVVTMHHKGLASRDGRSNGRVRGSGVLKRGDRKKESSKKRAIH